MRSALHASVGCLLAEVCAETHMRYGGTATPAHYDPVDNVVGQFCGSKRWRLWRPSSGEPSGTPDYDAVVAPGDALFVPRGWWHRVDSLPCATGAVSVSLWFDESGELPAFSNR